VALKEEGLHRLEDFREDGGGRVGVEIDSHDGRERLCPAYRFERCGSARLVDVSYLLLLR
jgi:hypothetical protein